MEKSPVLYHGTDARIVRMSKNERQNLKVDCMNAIDYMWQFFEPYYTQNVEVKFTHPETGEICTGSRSKLYEFENIISKVDPALFHNLRNALFCNEQRLKNNKQYTYDCTYLTTERKTAFHYAVRSFAFGELGLITLRMLNAAECIHFKGWNPPKAILDTLNWIKSFSENEENDDPIIIKVEEYDINLLESCEGAAITIKDIHLHQHVRYLGKMDFDLSKAEFLKKGKK